jgi:Ca2+-binding RTX toxin-like protein
VAIINLTNNDDIYSDTNTTNDSINGLAGNDSITGNNGNDTFIGGAGNDSLFGGTGSDTYLYNSGDGTDVIHDNFNSSSTNTLNLNDGSTLNSITLNSYGSSDDLTIGNLSSGQQITLTGQLQDSSGASPIINQLQFGTGTTPVSTTTSDFLHRIVFQGDNTGDFMQATSAGNAMLGGSKADFMFGAGGNDTISGNGGDDYIIGYGGSDLLQGGDGNDTLYSDFFSSSGYNQDGNSTIIGGAGDDSLVGDAGNDTFIYNAGDGNDSITDDSGLVGSSPSHDLNTLILNDGSTLDSLNLTSIGGSGDLTIGNLNGGSIYVYGQLQDPTGATPIIDQIQFGTGNTPISTSSNDFLHRIVYQANTTGKGNRLQATNAGNSILGGAGNDSLLGGSGNDSLTANAGNDSLISGAGNDILNGGAGNDLLEGDSGNDTYIFANGFGNDTLKDANGVDTLDFSQVTTNLTVNLTTGQASTPNEFQVNTYTNSDQGNPSVASLADGGYFVAWTSNQNGAYQVNGQRYNADGSPNGSEVNVSGGWNPGGYNFEPAVASLNNGDYAVAWMSSTNGYIFGQVFDSQGGTSGYEIALNPSGADTDAPSITGLSDGTYLITWQRSGPIEDGTSPPGIYGARFSANGAMQGSIFQINTTPTNGDGVGVIRTTSVTSLSNGGYVVSWFPFSGSGNLYAQAFDSNGNAQGSEIHIDNSFDSTPAIANLSNGGFVIT